MKNKFFSFVLVVFASGFITAQTHNTVDLSDKVYGVLQAAEVNGLCYPLSAMKPYTEKYIVEKLLEIRAELDAVEEKNYVQKTELEEIERQLERFTTYKNKFDFSRLNYRVEPQNEKFPVTFDVTVQHDGMATGGLYADSSQNSFGYETFWTLDFFGDFGKNISYRTMFFFELTKMPLSYMGDYYIGNWWKSTGDNENHTANDAWPTVVKKSDPRFIKKWRNYSVLPYSYKQHWDGSVYLFTNLTAGGLTGWPTDNSIGLGMFGELHGSFFNDHLEISAGRYNREWGGMDNGSSIFMNLSAMPFFAMETSFKLFKNLSLTSLFGTLEFPNQGYINSSGWYLYDSEWTNGEDDSVKWYNPQVTDAYFFQNLFAMTMLNVDYKYFHFDFGSTCILPKRFEPGYIFPLLDNVVYQNSIGDYDNLALFSDVRFQYPKIGAVWFSLYSDDITSFKSKFWEECWCAYAWQTGFKAAFPWLPFGSFSFRYTKVEPYCYTHPATKTPWYPYYIATSYTNKGASIGYYLQPNSDEFLVSFKTRPVSSLETTFNWQLIRHGSDWGDGAVDGSNLYSELAPGTDRLNKKKYFLHDGTYEWTNIFAVNCSYDLHSFNLPLTLNASIGYVYDWFTGVDINGQKNDSFHYINDAQYPEINGVVLSVGFTAFAK